MHSVFLRPGPISNGFASQAVFLILFPNKVFEKIKNPGFLEHRIFCGAFYLFASQAVSGAFCVPGRFSLDSEGSGGFSPRDASVGPNSS